MDRMLRAGVLILLFIVVISFVYGGVITKKDSELTAEFLKNELGIEVISEGGCKGCSYIRNDDTFEEVLTIPQGLRIKKCIEFCWLGDLKLDGGTIVYDDGTELTAKASCIGICSVEKGDIKMKSGETLHVENLEMYVDKGVIKGGCKKGSCRFSVATLKQGSNFVYENGVLNVDKGDVYTRTGSFKIKLGDQKARIILPDGGKVKTDEIVEMVSDGYILPQKSELTTKDNIMINVDDKTKVIPIGNKAGCKTGSNCIKFDDKSIDIYGGGVDTRLPKNFDKQIKTFPKLKGKEITIVYPDGVKVIAKGEKGYPKIEPPGKSVNGYSMNGEKLSYMINGDDVQVCSIEFNELTGSVVGVDGGPRCEEGKITKEGVLKIGSRITDIGLPLKKADKCNADYLEMPDGTKPVDINKDGLMDYIVDVGKDACFGYKEYKEHENECKRKDKRKEKMKVCIDSIIESEDINGLFPGKRYNVDEAEQPINIATQQPTHQPGPTLLEQTCPMGTEKKYFNLKKNDFNALYYSELNHNVDNYCSREWGKKDSDEYRGCTNALEQLCIVYTTKKMFP